jgi:hypothetical protein
METGYVNKFCLSLFACYYVQPQTEAHETLPLLMTAWLACFARVGVCFILYSFSRY